MWLLPSTDLVGSADPHSGPIEIRRRLVAGVDRTGHSPEVHGPGSESPAVAAGRMLAMPCHAPLTKAVGVRGGAGGCLPTPADNDLVAADGSATLGPASVGLVAVRPGPHAVAVAGLLASDSRLAQALGMALLPPDHNGSAYLATLASRCWGQGVMSQSFSLALAEARRLGMRSAGGFVEHGNIASARIWQHHHPTVVITERGTEYTVWL